MDLVKAPERTHNVASIDRVENWVLYTASIAMKVGVVPMPAMATLGSRRGDAFCFRRKE